MRLQISPFRSTTTRPNKSLFNQYQFFFNKITIGHLLESIASQASSRLCPQMYGKNNVAKARTSIFPTDNRYALAELCEPGETANLEPAEKTKHVRYRDIQCPSFFVWDSGWSSWWFIYIMYVYIYICYYYVQTQSQKTFHQCFEKETQEPTLTESTESWSKRSLLISKLFGSDLCCLSQRSPQRSIHKGWGQL